jgi:hypothetical protein
MSNQADVVKMLKAAGYDVQYNGNTFSVYQDGKRVLGFSSIRYLSNMKYMIEKVVIHRAYQKGILKGKEVLKRDLKELLA